jgi:phosphohistidine swiveling domain-containing protein
MLPREKQSAGRAVGGRTSTAGYSPGVALITDLTDDPGVGGKARSLARLKAAGLPTPPGFVVTDALFRALRAAGAPLPERLDGPALETLAEQSAQLETAPLPPEFVPELSKRLAALGATRLAVRSSFSSEDEPGALAAGLYQSQVNVPAPAVAAAIRQVLRSALGPGAIAYARARGRSPEEAPVAVLVHAYIDGEASGHAASDPNTPEAGIVIDARTGALTEGARDRLENALRSLAKRHGAVEVEWVARGEQVTFLQLRPYLARPRPQPWHGATSLSLNLSLSLGEEGQPEPWRWDASHNPLPLSPAQAGLVALVDARCRTGLRQRVLGGYLFYAPGGPAPGRTIAPEQAASELQALVHALESRLPRGKPDGLEEALDIFLATYEPLFGVVQPAARRGRALVEEFLRATLPEALPLVPALLAGVDSKASERRRLAERIARAHTEEERRRALAEYLDVFGDEAPLWDVASPTWRERPETLLRAIETATPGLARTSSNESLDQQRAARQVLEKIPHNAQRTWQAVLATARACVAVSEDDDWLYARAQAAVRRALLAVAGRLAAEGVLAKAEDAFFLPLERLRAMAAGAASAHEAAALSAAGRAASEAARADPPPLSAASFGAASIIRGAGTGGRAVGRVVQRHGPQGQAPPVDAVLVATSLLPTELPLLHPAALVVETGGPLDHVATQARERRLPAVVGAEGAIAALRDADLVVVDADQGIVVRL